MKGSYVYKSHPEYRAARQAKNDAYRKSPAGRARKRVQEYFASLRRRYGITRADYDALLEIQKGCCAVCRLPFKRKPSVDHDHETGKVRGILCQPCNTVEGLIRKAGLTPRQYSALLKWYLEDPPAGALASKAASHGR